MKKVGVLGYGNLGQYLVGKILESEQFELSFVWNRDKNKFANFPKPELILDNIEDLTSRQCDLVIEVSHPNVVKTYGTSILEHADFLIGSPTALANDEVLSKLKKCSESSGNGVYVPAGAFWGGEDIKRMADLNTLTSLKVTMKKHPGSFKLESPLKGVNDLVLQNGGSSTLCEGPVKTLCPLAPNNVNTMAAAAIAGHNLGFEVVIGSLVSDTKLTDCHIVEIDIHGKNGFHVNTKRINPAVIGAVTGQATYQSFYSSLLRAGEKGSGIHLC